MYEGHPVRVYSIRVIEQYGLEENTLEGKKTETRVAVMSIIVDNAGSVQPLNELLHEYGEYIIGRMGIPYRKMNISIISIAIDAPQDTLSALAGKIGRLPGLSVKTAYSNVVNNEA